MAAAWGQSSPSVLFIAVSPIHRSWFFLNDWIGEAKIFSKIDHIMLGEEPSVPWASSLWGAQGTKGEDQESEK